MSQSPLHAAYKTLLSKGRLKVNPGQLALVERLAELQTSLQRRNHALRGLYIYGSVGTGKSRIADLFAATLPDGISKRRIHFHEFMLDMHSRLHRARSLAGYAGDPLVQIGREVQAESKVLCFDEFQVTDIADAMILQRLFGSIWKAGGVMVSTSNRHPDKLYENGLNRALFIPFIEELQRRCEVWRMEGDQDYRLTASGEREVVFYNIHGAFEGSLANSINGSPLEALTIPVMMGRSLLVQASGPNDGETGLIVSATFADLCERNLGSADYHALCAKARTIYLSGLRQFRTNELDFARRFITLIDLAYESRTRVICHSDTSLNEIFEKILQREKVSQGLSEPKAKQALADGMSVRKGGGSSSSMMSTFIGETEWSATGLPASLATGGAGETDVVFAVGRAVSRLHEMGSKSYGLQD